MKTLKIYFAAAKTEMVKIDSAGNKKDDYSDFGHAWYVIEGGDDPISLGLGAESIKEGGKENILRFDRENYLGSKNLPIAEISSERSPTYPKGPEVGASWVIPPVGGKLTGLSPQFLRFTEDEPP